MNKDIDTAFHAMADGTRRTILSLVSKEELRMTDIASQFDMSIPAVSKHLKVLESAGLIQRRIDGRIHYFKAVPGALNPMEQMINYYQQFWGQSLEQLEKLFNQ